MTEIFDYSELICPRLYPRDIHKKAEEFREKFWPKGALPVDIELIAEKMGFYWKSIGTVSDKFDALLQINDENDKSIIVNKKFFDNETYENRLRFSIAHEVKHYVLHKKIIVKVKEIIGGFSEEDYLDKYYYTFIKCFPEDQWRYFEYQANEFAGRLLVPHERLKQEIHKILGDLRKDPDISKMIEDDPNGVLSWASTSLCKPFGVSADCIERRAKNEKLWPESF